jgi:hypothetical protein
VIRCQHAGYGKSGIFIRRDQNFVAVAAFLFKAPLFPTFFRHLVYKFFQISRDSSVNRREIIWVMRDFSVAIQEDGDSDKIGILDTVGRTCERSDLGV